MGLRDNLAMTTTLRDASWIATEIKSSTLLPVDVSSSVVYIHLYSMGTKGGIVVASAFKGYSDAIFVCYYQIVGAWKCVESNISKELSVVAC